MYKRDVMMYGTHWLLLVLLALPCPCRAAEKRSPLVRSHDGTDFTSCSKTLNLSCPNGHVVTAEVYAVVTATPPTVSGGECERQADDCLDEPLTVLVDIRRCVWKDTACRLTPGNGPLFLKTARCGLRGSYLLAKNFVCVPSTQLYEFCHSATGEEKLTSRHGYITTPGYPAQLSPSLNCNATIDVPAGHVLHLRVISSFLPDDECDNDYVEIQDGCDHSNRRFCSNVNYTSDVTWTLSGPTVTLTLLTRKETRMYEGVAFHYSILPGTVEGCKSNDAIPSHTYPRLLMSFEVLMVLSFCRLFY